MDQNQRFLAIGIYINAALYLSGVFIIGIWNSWPACKVAVLAAGISYFAYYAQVIRLQRWIINTCVYASIAAGAIAGLLLLR